MRNKIKSKLQISKSSWSPQKSHDEYVNYYSIPNFDLGFPKEEKTSEIKSGKFLINQPCILISKLNPRTPRVWLIHDLLSGVNVCSTEFVVLIPNEKLDLKYLYFLLKSNTVTNKLTDMSTGTSNSHQRVRPESILELEVDWNENANERYVLSEFLWGLEQKISTNNAISKNLEDIAQTIFKSWFIDFDPVKAKMNGEKPEGMDDETAALFPDSFEESELGLIPKGWEVKTIGSICETLLGGTPSRAKDDYWNGDIPWINSGKINEFRVLTASEYITKRGLDNSATKLLPTGTTVIAITGATLGQFSRLEIEACANQSVIGIIGSPVASNEFIYMQIKNGIQRLISAQTGGAQQHINKEDVNNFNIIYPNQALVSKFTSEVSGIFLQIGTLLKQSITLSSIRDTLLPRLISGELQVSDEMLAS